MNFQNLKQVKSWEEYLDKAFAKAKKKADCFKDKKIPRFSKIKQSALLRIDVVRAMLTDNMNSIVKDFPSFDQMDDFYKELVKTALPYAEVRKSLGAVNWARKQVLELYRATKRKIQRERDEARIPMHWKSFYGRISSVLKQIKNAFQVLEEARKSLKKFPDIKEMPTVAVFGFPNVGKTTLLFFLTGSKPEIKEYAFTTKGINLAYLKGVQLIDTPGTLNRFEKMNMFEKQAWLVLKYLAEYIVYVYDPSGQYPLEDQKKLHKKVKKQGFPISVYISKADILPLEAQELAKEVGGETDPKKIKKELLSFFAKVEKNPSQ